MERFFMLVALLFGLGSGVFSQVVVDSTLYFDGIERKAYYYHNASTGFKDSSVTWYYSDLSGGWERENLGYYRFDAQGRLLADSLVKYYSSKANIGIYYHLNEYKEDYEANYIYRSIQNKEGWYLYYLYEYEYDNGLLMVKHSLSNSYNDDGVATTYKLKYEYEYDELNRLILEEISGELEDGSWVKGNRTTFEYDDRGMILREEYRSGTILTNRTVWKRSENLVTMNNYSYGPDGDMNLLLTTDSTYYNPDNPDQILRYWALYLNDYGRIRDYYYENDSLVKEMVYKIDEDMEILFSDSILYRVDHNEYGMRTKYVIHSLSYIDSIIYFYEEDRLIGGKKFTFRDGVWSEKDIELNISTKRNNYKVSGRNITIYYGDLRYTSVRVAPIRQFELLGNYPNPFNPRTTIECVVDRPGNIRVEIYNSAGQRIGVVFDEWHAGGHLSINFNADNLASGMYLYRVSGQDKTLTGKMILLK
jgi:hypothetical protein